MLSQARRSTALVVLAIALLAQAVATRPAPASGTRTKLPFRGFVDLYVDHERGRVFVSGGPESTSIQVFDFDGRFAGAVEPVSGAADMLADGGLLYVAYSDGRAIAVVDLESLQVMETIDTAPYQGPFYLSKSNDTIYFSYSCRGGAPGFASVDLVTRVPLAHDPPNPSADRCARHEVSPEDPSTMLAWDEGGSAVRRYDVSARQPVLQEESTGDSFLDQLVFSKDATTFYAVSWEPGVPGPTVVARGQVEGLTYKTAHAKAGAGIALSSGERLLFTGNINGIHDEDVLVYRPGRRSPVSANEIDDRPGRGEQILPGALGTTPSGDRVFTVHRTPGQSPGNLRFQVVWPRYGVVTGPGLQSLPAASTRYTVWSHQPRGAKLETLMARAGKRVWQVSPPGTSGYAGGIEGTRLVYQVVRGESSDLRLYDLARRRQASTLGRLNTRGWEWRPTISRGRVLFSRYDGRRERVVVHTLRTGAEQVLADVPLITHQAVAGQINGPWAVWSQCYRACIVLRQNLDTGEKVRVPGPRGRVDYAASVTRAGVVYFGRSGIECGTNASLKRYAGGRVTTIQDLQYGQDFFSSYAVPGTNTVMFDFATCTTKYGWDIFSVRDVPG